MHAKSSQSGCDSKHRYIQSENRSLCSDTPAETIPGHANYRTVEGSPGVRYQNLLQDASRLLETGRKDLAALAAQAASEIYPNRSSPYLIMLNALAEDAQKLDIISLCKKLIRVNPACVEAHNRLGAALMQSGDATGAYRTAKTLAALEPESAAHRLKLAMLCQHLGFLPAAMKEFSRVIHLAPDQPLAESARESLDVLDITQLNEIITLAIDDQRFRMMLARNPEEAVLNRGYCLSANGLEMLLDFCINTLPAIPDYAGTIHLQ